MATTSGDHPLTYPNEGAKNWYGTYENLMQSITIHLDNLDVTQINTIEDANDNEMLKFSSVANAINYVQIANAATGNAPSIAALGDDTNVDLQLTPKAAGDLVLGGLKFPQADGSANQALTTNGSAQLSFTTVLLNVVEDTTPQLGGALDVNSNEIVSVSSGDIDLHSDADILLELGDAAGSNKVSVRDSGGSEVASINSDGDISCTDLTANSLTLTTALTGTSVDINGATAETSVADADEVLIYDADAGANRKMTKANLVASIPTDWSLVSTTNASSQSTVDIDLDQSANVYRVVAYNLVTADDDVDVNLRFSNAATTSFKSGASDYEWTMYGRYGSVAIGRNASGDDLIEINDVTRSGHGNASGEHARLDIVISLPHDTGAYTTVKCENTFMTADGNLEFCETGGFVAATQDNDAIQIATTGTSGWTSGTVKLYKLNES